MRTSTLLSLSAVLALVCAVSTIGCSEPDVGSYDGSGAQKGAGDDDDDDDSTSKAATSKATTKTADTATPATVPTTASTTTVPTTTTTPDQCFAHCVQPVPEAVALNTCTAKCSSSDINCLGDCFDSSGCGNNPNCSAAVDQCSTKCNP